MPHSWTQLQIELRLDRPRSPRLQTLYDLWHSKRRGGAIPDRDDIDPLLECDPRLLPHLFLLDALESPTDFRFRLVGTGIVATEERDNTGKRLGDCGYGRDEGLLRAIYEKVVAEQAPLGFTGTLLWQRRERLDVEALHLPLARSGDKVAMILGTMLFSQIGNSLLSASPARANSARTSSARPLPGSGQGAYDAARSAAVRPEAEHGRDRQLHPHG